MTTKTYNSRFQLTPMPVSNRWRKIYKGKTYYVGVGHCRSKSDREGYQVAIEEWRGLREQLDNEPTDEDRQEYRRILEARERLSQEFHIATPEETERLNEAWERQKKIVEKFEGKRQRTRPNTIKHSIDNFIADKQGRHATHDLSAGRVNVAEYHLRQFEKWIGGSSLISTIDDNTLTDYRAELVRAIEAKEISQTTAADRIHTLREWLGETRSAPPKKLRSRNLTIGRPEPTIIIFTNEEIKTLLTNTPDHFRLWVLLALNCGMTQADISDLKPTEIDWERGTITRKRSKTKKKNVPVVCHPLWCETFRLLKQLGNKTGERVLTNRNGKPLVYRGYNSNGKMEQKDSVYDGYRRLFPTGKPFKCLRKTGASKLDDHDTYGRYITHYLGHSPKGYADRNYKRPSQEQFDKAVRWLGSQFGIE